MTRFLKVIILVLFLTTSISEAVGQLSNVNGKSFQVPNSRMEIRIGEKSYSVLKNGVEKEFQQKNKIRFRNLTFDPLAMSPEEFVPQFLKQKVVLQGSLKEGQDAEHAYIVQFKTQAFEGYQKEIGKIGGRIYTPLHDHALIIVLNNVQLDEIKKLPYVRWVGIYHPTFKLGAMAGDCVVFCHYIAINVVVGAAQEDDQVVVFSPDNASVTTIRTMARGLQMVELGRTANTQVN